MIGKGKMWVNKILDDFTRQVNVIWQQPLRVLHLTMYMDKFKTGQHRTAFATAAMFFSVYHHFWSCKIAWTLMQYIKCLSLLWSLNFPQMGITSWNFNQRNRQFQTKMENKTLLERPLSLDIDAWLISTPIMLRKIWLVIWTPNN